MTEPVSDSEAFLNAIIDLNLRDDPAQWPQGQPIASGMGGGALAFVACALLLVSALAFCRQPQLAACGVLRSSGRATCTSGCPSQVKASELGWFGWS